MTESPIRVVDFSPCALDNVKDSECQEVKETVDLIAEALEQHGCVHLINHGVDATDLQTLRAKAQAFFNLPVAEKMKCVIKRMEGGNGWIGNTTEKLGEKKGDLKECYDMNPGKVDITQWPNDDLVPGFRDVNKNFMKKLDALGRRLLELLGRKYCPQDPTIFLRAHKDMGTVKNTGTCLRPIYYPPMSSYEGVQPGQLRCGAHTDFGSITFLFQDMIGGLEVLGSDDEWFDVPPLDGAILLQTGDMMEVWTAGRIKAPVHRVRNPTGDKLNQARECTAYFLMPDDDFLVKCLNGSDKYPPIQAVQHFTTNVYAIHDENDKEN